MPEDVTKEQLVDSGELKSDSPIQLTNPPKDPAIEKLEAGLNEVRSMMGQLVNHVKQPAPVVEDKQEALTQEEFFKNPQALLDRVGTMLEKAVAPLNQFKDEFKGNQQVENIKAKIRRDPKLAKAMEIVGEDLDTAIATMKPEHLNEGAIGGLLLTLYGNKVLNAGEGGIITNKPAPNPILPSNSQVKDMSDVPAHLRPSGNKAAPSPAPTKTELSADEERVMTRFAYDPKNEEHRKEFKAAADEGENRGNRVQIVGKEIGGR